MIPQVGARVMGLDSPESKMSKSAQGENHAIFLLDSPDVITRKCKKAVTDSQSNIVFDESRAGLYNLLCIYEIFTQKSRKSIEVEFEGKGYGHLKMALAEVIIESLRPIQESYAKISQDKAYIQSVLTKSADSIRPIAKATYENAKRLVGLV